MLSDVKYQTPLRVVEGEGTDETPSAALIARSRALKDRSRSTNTRLADERDWAHFAAWCQSTGYVPLPAETVAVELYLAAHEELLKPSTLERRLSSISQRHKAAGYPSPTRSDAVLDTLSGIKREQGTDQAQKAPLLLEDLVRVAAALPADTLIGRRDRALLLLGFAGAFRASELGAITVRDLFFTPEGVIVTLRRSKTDQVGAGREVGIPNGKDEALCPVRALQSWITEAGIKKGPILRPVNFQGKVSEKPLTRFGVTYIVKRAASAAGLDPALYSAHSLRAGHVTAAARARVPTDRIRLQTGHKSERILNRYIRHANLFIDNSASLLGL